MTDSQIKEMSVSMDLTPEEVEDLFGDAEATCQDTPA
jgi:hypothetical protein